MSLEYITALREEDTVDKYNVHGRRSIRVRHPLTIQRYPSNKVKQLKSDDFPIPGPDRLYTGLNFLDIEDRKLIILLAFPQVIAYQMCVKIMLNFTYCLFINLLNSYFTVFLHATEVSKKCVRFTKLQYEQLGVDDFSGCRVCP